MNKLDKLLKNRIVAEAIVVATLTVAFIATFIIASGVVVEALTIAALLFGAWFLCAFVAANSQSKLAPFGARQLGKLSLLRRIKNKNGQVTAS